MITRLRGQQGFGLIELLMALTMLNIGILAIVAAFNSGAVALQRAAKLSTAAALADSQMELYRALTYGSIALDTAEVTTNPTGAQYNTTYNTDTAYNASQVTATCSVPLPKECKPIQTVIGPDGKSYRVDTFIVYDTPSSGRQLKKVTIVVRDGLAVTKPPLARVASTFDQATGS